MILEICELGQVRALFGYFIFILLLHVFTIHCTSSSVLFRVPPVKCGLGFKLVSGSSDDRKEVLPTRA